MMTFQNGGVKRKSKWPVIRKLLQLLRNMPSGELSGSVLRPKNSAEHDGALADPQTSLCFGLCRESNQASGLWFSRPGKRPFQSPKRLSLQPLFLDSKAGLACLLMKLCPSSSSHKAGSLLGHMANTWHWAQTLASRTLRQSLRFLGPPGFCVRPQPRTSVWLCPLLWSVSKSQPFSFASGGNSYFPPAPSTIHLGVLHALGVAERTSAPALPLPRGGGSESEPKSHYHTVTVPAGLGWLQGQATSTGVHLFWVEAELVLCHGVCPRPGTIIFDRHLLAPSDSAAPDDSLSPPHHSPSIPDPSVPLSKHHFPRQRPQHL